MRMSKTQPMLVGALMVTVLLGFQNCSKVGVEDISSSDPGVATALDIPTDDGAGDLPDSPGTTSSNPPINPDGPTTYPPISNEPPTKYPPIKEPKCRPMSEILIKNSDDSEAMQTAACLSDQGESCVLVCHLPPGNPSNAQQKMFKSSGAVKAHLAHGDTLGLCKEQPDQQPSDTEVCEEDGGEEEPVSHEHHERCEHSGKGHGQNQKENKSEHKDHNGHGKK